MYDDFTMHSSLNPFSPAALVESRCLQLVTDYSKINVQIRTNLIRRECRLKKRNKAECGQLVTEGIARKTANKIIIP